MDANLPENGLDVDLHRRFGNGDLARDHLVRTSFNDVTQDGFLAGRQLSHGGNLPCRRHFIPEPGATRIRPVIATAVATLVVTFVTKDKRKEFGRHNDLAQHYQFEGFHQGSGVHNLDEIGARTSTIDARRISKLIGSIQHNDPPGRTPPSDKFDLLNRRIQIFACIENNQDSFVFSQLLKVMAIDAGSRP